METTNEIGQMLSPDSYIQFPDDSQSFNRYSYALNNPLKYTDPTGNKLKWWQWALIGLGADVLTGGAISTTAGLTAMAATTTVLNAPFLIPPAPALSLMAFNITTYTLTLPFQHTLSAIDITVNFLRSGEGDYKGVWNAMKIDFGKIVSFLSIFDFDKSASPFGWALQIYNHFSFGEQLQTSIGNGFSHLQNIGNHVDDVGYYKGRTVIRLRGDYIGDDLFRGISFGYYLMGDNIAFNPFDKEHDVSLFVHEYAHTYQSRMSGLLYLFKYGIPSAAGSNKPEDDADWRAYRNFGINPWGRLDLNNYGPRRSRR